MPTKRSKTDKGMIVSSRLGPPFEAILADFVIESAEVRKQHDWWITERLAPHIKRRGAQTRWKIYLTGMTSQSGTDNYNKTLSKKRALEVEKRIRESLPGIYLSFETGWVGESRASEAWEGAIDRAVHVAAQAFHDGEPPPTPPPPPDIPPDPEEDDDIGGYAKSQRFRLQVLGYTAFSYKIGGYLHMTINIADELRKKHCYYRLNAPQIAVSRGSPVDSHSGKDTNPPSNFFTVRGKQGLPLTTADFAGTVGLSKSKSRFELRISASGTDYPAVIHNLAYKDTGWLSEDVYAAYAGYMHDLSGELGWDQYRDYIDYGRSDRINAQPLRIR